MTNKSALLILLLVLLSMQKVFGQAEGEAIEKESSFSEFIHNDNIAFKFSYFGELGLHPGLEIGTDFTIVNRKRVKIHWDTGLGGFWHRWNNTSLFAKSTIGARFYFWSAFVDINAGVGYMHSFLAGTVYGISENGVVEEVRDFGSSHFMPNASLLFGWDGTRKKNLPFAIHVGPEVYLQSNFNHIFLPHVAAKIGVIYKFK